MPSKKSSIFGLLAAILLPVSILAAAQTATPPSQGSRPPPSSRVNSTQLHRFAAAYRAVTKIRKRLLIETHSMTDKDKITALKKQAEEKMKQAIRAHLTLGEYVRIGRAVNANPALHARFMRIRNSASGAPSPASAGG